MQTPCLKVLSGIGAGQILRLDRPVAHLGRGSGNDLVLDDPNISRVHVRVCRAQGGICVIDLDTTNGTTVQGEPINSRLLAEGDEVRLGGGVTLQFTHLEMEPLTLLTDLDENTGALNQQAWLDRLQVELQRSRAEGAPLVVALVELDQWSRDEAQAVHLAESLRVHVRTQALVGRLEPNLFALILPDLSLASSKALLEELLPLGVCIGASGPSPEALTPAELLDTATGALLAAQAEGPGSLFIHGLLGFGDTQTLRRQKRLSTRLECLHKVTCVQGGQRWESTVRDVGLQGLRLLVPRRLEPSATLDVSHTDPLTPVNVRVVWCKPYRTQFEVGVVYSASPQELQLTWLRPFLDALQGTSHPAAERRTEARSRVQVQAWVRPQGQAPMVGQMANLGLTGGLLVAPSPVAAGEEVMLNLQTSTALPVMGRVVHSYEFAPHHFMGVAFRDVGTAEQAHLEKLLTAF